MHGSHICSGEGEIARITILIDSASTIFTRLFSVPELENPAWLWTIIFLVWTYLILLKTLLRNKSDFDRKNVFFLVRPERPSYFRISQLSSSFPLVPFNFFSHEKKISRKILSGLGTIRNVGEIYWEGVLSVCVIEMKTVNNEQGSWNQKQIE